MEVIQEDWDNLLHFIATGNLPDWVTPQAEHKVLIDKYFKPDPGESRCFKKIFKEKGQTHFSNPMAKPSSSGYLDRWQL